MNQRIKQLAEQAEKYADDNFKGEPTYSEAYDSKFAELIVRECTDHIMNSTDRYRKEYFANMIKEHFGVKE
jgi:hypothetical protein